QRAGAAEHAGTAEGRDRAHASRRRKGRPRSGVDRHRLCLVHAAKLDGAVLAGRRAADVHRQRGCYAGGRRGAEAGRGQALHRLSAAANDRTDPGNAAALRRGRGTEGIVMTDRIWIENASLTELTTAAAAKRDAAHGRLV